MISRQAYEQASKEFKANRSVMSATECEEARKSLNKMFKELQLQEAVKAFKAGEKIEAASFLWLCEVYKVEINESFNDLMQNSVVSVSTSGYDSYKIGKRQETQLKGFILKLLEAVQ
ncbi:hypothetical protein D3C85_794220 [compost metagenome]